MIEDKKFPLNFSVLSYFQDFTDEYYDYLYSFIEETKRCYNTEDNDSLKLIIYLSKVSSFLVEVFNLFDCSSDENLSEKLISITKNKISSFLNPFERYIEVNSLFFLYNNKHIQLKKKFEIGELSKVWFKITNDQERKEDKSFSFNKKLVFYASRSHGRLDLFMQAHILKTVLLKFPDLEKIVKQEIDVLSKMESDLLKIIENVESQRFDYASYLTYVDKFVAREENKMDLIKQLKKLFVCFQHLNDQDSLRNFEKLFIQLLGSEEKNIRHEAVRVLNMYYDETNWQEKQAFENVVLKERLDEFKFEFYLKQKDFDEANSFIITNAPSIHLKVQNNIFSWNKFKNFEIVNIHDQNYVKIKIDFKKFTRCGYYDWNIGKIKDGRLTPIRIILDINKPNDLTDGLGRFIVLEKSLRDISIHEIFVDLLNSQIDRENGRIKKRGDFKALESKLVYFFDRHINCLYLMGALERDNQICVDESTHEVIDIGNYESSPMSVICRSTVSRLLGGDEAFKSVIEKAKKFSMKIILDSLARVSSSRFNRKYRNVILSHLDEKGKVNLCYGTDGISTSFEDSALLNYRKVEAWNLLVEDILSLAKKYDIDGVHLDNCQAWPQILKTNLDEMTRLDSDFKPSYSNLDIMNGEIVYPDEDCGYWDSDESVGYPNPMLIKLSKTVWHYFPKFIFIGECWMTTKFVNRHINLMKSGIVPRLYTLPRTLSNVFGRKIHKNGLIEPCNPCDVGIFREWFDENYKDLPEGALFIQSNCGQMWPYPSLLYGRGNWAAVDLLFMLPDIPMTFMGEIDGESYRIQISNLYLIKQVPKNNPRIARSQSHITLDYEDEENEKEKKEEKKESSNKIAKVRSLGNMSNVTLQEAKTIKEKQEKVNKELGPEYGFDLTKIKLHYDHRTKMRKSHESLRRGAMVYLNTYDNEKNPHPHVFAFARVTSEETGIIAINFKNHVSNFQLDLGNLKEKLSSNINFNTMCYIEDWILEEKGDYYFMAEVISDGYIRTLAPFTSMCFGIQVIESSKENFKLTYEKSVSRMINLIKSFKNIDNCRIALQLREILIKNFPISQFISWFSLTLEAINKYDVSLTKLISSIDFLNNDSSLSAKFLAYCTASLDEKNLSVSLKNSISFIVSNNKMGPIVFVTPELGRWSTVGGLGVMVDELSQGLVTLGQEVIMISPYYHQNRKGEIGYLEKDPAGFQHIGNITVTLDEPITFGIHYGVVHGVKLYFLHNRHILPSPYADGPAQFILKQISNFSKAALECLCFAKIIPEVILTNDWFTGLVAAYSKHGHFGDVFKGCTFFHIVHNLERSYEGRIYTPENKTLEEIHRLPNDCLIDPFWKVKVLNPSRCALMCSDQWGTVSKSYRKELLEGSDLNSLLRNFTEPFAFPNGIFRAQRLKVIQDKVKMSRQDAKKYIQTKYFKMKKLDESVPVFAFVGRITQQKGVILILEAAEQIILKHNEKINILVGGMGNPKDPYCESCTHKINYLIQKYPNCFWANPNEFFTDGPTINVGADFGLMPSMFEPGGIVQHEFFIASTPVLAFKTGGLKDTVFEFDLDTLKGNGITFEEHSVFDLQFAFERAIQLFKNTQKYEKCRKNAFNSAIDVLDVGKAWSREFARLREKLFVMNCDVQTAEYLKILKSQVKDNSCDKFNFDEINKELNAISSVIDEKKISITFSYSDSKPKVSSVQICGSFDKWQIRHNLSFDPIQNKWTVTLKIKRGEHFYKYIVDGEWKISNFDKSVTDYHGFLNNVIKV